MLAGWLLLHGGNGNGVTVVTTSFHTQTHRFVFLSFDMSLCRHFEANSSVTLSWVYFVWQTAERSEISASTRTFTHCCWAGSATTGSRLEWSSIRHTAWGALYTDKTHLICTHATHIHNSLKTSCAQALPNKRGQPPNKTSIKETAESSLHLDAVSVLLDEVFHLLNKNWYCSIIQIKSL